jgi:serine/threonine protein kinase
MRLASDIHPVAITDLVLAAVAAGGIRAVSLNCNDERSDDNCTMLLNSANRGTSAVDLDRQRANAVVARLALLAKLDLMASHSSTGVIQVASGTCRVNVMATLRPHIKTKSARTRVTKAMERSIDLLAMPALESLPSSDENSHAGFVAGEIVDHYKIGECLGEGGMGKVYRVEHVSIGRTYALKVLNTRASKSSAAATQFLQEARAAARIRHPHIVDVFDFGHTKDGRPYLVMELLVGESLRAHIEREQLKIAEAVAVAKSLACALTAAHDRGIVHSDVSPSNIFIEGENLKRLKLVDFGLARFVDAVPPSGDSLTLAGTPYYVSPEQIRGKVPTPLSDQYCFGAVLFELLSGLPPYLHSEVRSICLMHLSTPIPKVKSPFGSVPTQLADLVTRCLQKRAEHRFASMHEVVEELNAIEQQLPAHGWRLIKRRESV